MSTLAKSVEPGTSRAPKRHQVPGEPGTWVFIFGDMTIFAFLFVTYLSFRAKDPELYNASQHTLKQNYGAINTLLLLASSLFVILGVRAIRTRMTAVGPWMFAGALACGLAFIGMKALEWGEKIDHDITPTTNDFFMYYYAITGLHLLHLLLGMGVLVFLIVKARSARLSRNQMTFVEGGACFWHMVDLLWIVLFPLLYFMR